MSEHVMVAVDPYDGGTTVCRGCRAQGTFTESPAGDCPTPYKSDRQLLAEALEREVALDQRCRELEVALRDSKDACIDFRWAHRQELRGAKRLRATLTAARDKLGPAVRNGHPALTELAAAEVLEMLEAAHDA